MKNYGLDEIQDIIVVGAGPTALVILHEAQQFGLKALAIDKGPVCSALLKHPTYMKWFSTSDKLELAGFPLLCEDKNPTRREYLRYCRAFSNYFNLKVVTYREVQLIQPAEYGFDIHAKDIYDRDYLWKTRNVVAATGFYDSPRPLNVPGGDLPKVTHRYDESHMYADHDVLVVGAGSSAVEVSLELYRAGARVTVVMRGEKFHTKYWLEPDIENRIKEGSIACYRNAELSEIHFDDVLLRQANGDIISVPNDFVLAMTGYEPNTEILECAGAVVDAATKKPTLSAAFESTVPGLYVAGTLCAGCESNIIFVENSREHAAPIVADVRRKMERS